MMQPPSCLHLHHGGAVAAALHRLVAEMLYVWFEIIVFQIILMFLMVLGCEIVNKLLKTFSRTIFSISYKNDFLAK